MFEPRSCTWAKHEASFKAICTEHNERALDNHDSQCCDQRKQDCDCRRQDGLHRHECFRFCFCKAILVQSTKASLHKIQLQKCWSLRLFLFHLFFLDLFPVPANAYLRARGVRRTDERQLTEVISRRIVLQKPRGISKILWVICLACILSFSVSALAL